MSSASLEILLKRGSQDRRSAIAVMTALAWVYLIWLAQTMSIAGTTMANMPGMDMGAAVTPMLRV